MPDAIVLYHLEDFQPEDSALEKRRNVCERILAAGLACVVIGGAIKGAVLQISSVIKHASNMKTCTTFTGRAGPDGELFYRYSETIAGALEHHFKKDNSKMCGTQCLDLTHGGTWNGYLAIGPAKSFNHKLRCGPELNFNNCDSGGKGDLH
ncbi:uncharacterized protein FTOL_03577 [Fusarium torulosum]|uniref:Secreted protein CSS2 C-terminal domain-containing protein n=1 Tax=Fusarium torulosum TaxID=33205 RepID=A0AAE8SFU7_9HYPO|nr:uncharacterized protein FTOL_03577 [Fusarium torulosum]